MIRRRALHDLGVWFRRDARLDDNPALAAASAEGPVCALFVIDPTLYDNCSRRRRDLLVAGLTDLDRSIEERGDICESRLVTPPLSCRRWQEILE